MALNTLQKLLTGLALTPSISSIQARNGVQLPAAATALTSLRTMHTTVALKAKAQKHSSANRKKKKERVAPDQRIINLKLSMPRKVPAPLRFGRNRALRHWTIHRAWLLFQRKERERRERELNRMYASMHNACEELRKTSGPGTRDEGFLYRVALEKKGIYNHGGIPMDYARAQTETPARVAWDHDWKP
jgi:large subunit ribosomal protein L40